MSSECNALGRAIAGDSLFPGREKWQIWFICEEVIDVNICDTLVVKMTPCDVNG